MRHIGVFESHQVKKLVVGWLSRVLKILIGPKQEQLVPIYILILLLPEWLMRSP
jgi:hypothetical protein